MAARSEGRPFVVDANNHPIPGGSAIVDIQAVAVANGSWTTVALLDVVNMACKTAYCRMRASGTWLLARVATGATYITMGPEPFYLDISKRQGEILFWVNPTTTGTFEVMLLD